MRKNPGSGVFEVTVGSDTPPFLIGNKVSGVPSAQKFHLRSSEDPVCRNSGNGVFEVLVYGDTPMCLIGNKVSGAQGRQKPH